MNFSFLSLIINAVVKSLGFLFFFLVKMVCKGGKEEILCQYTFQKSSATEERIFLSYPSIVNLLVAMI